MVKTKPKKAPEQSDLDFEREEKRKARKKEYEKLSRRNRTGPVK